jgi:NAD(P)-dependent dehydrogenase (short-subunit alcohol dehydrogenase family)
MTDAPFDFLSFPPGAVAVVTGAAAGIGRQIADDLAAAGVAVAGWDSSADGIAAFEREVEASGGRARGLHVDVSDPGRVEAAFAQTIEELGPASFLVNNAGPASGTPFSFVDGLAASLGSVQAVTEAWLRTDGAVDGHLVNISSVAGSMIGVGATSWYPAAKAGIAGYTRWLALNRPRGIRANAVAPGVIETGRTRQLLSSPEGRAVIERNPMGRAGRPSDISAAVLFLLAPVSHYINGVLLPVDGGSLITQ